MKAIKKVGLGVLIAFGAFLILGYLATVLVPVEETAKAPEKVVAEKKEKPKPRKAVVKKKQLELEPITYAKSGYLYTQCYATNQTGKTWKNSVQMRLYRLDGSILHSSANHIWIEVEIEPGERTFYAAKVSMPWVNEFIVEWEWGGQKIRTEYRK